MFTRAMRTTYTPPGAKRHDVVRDGRDVCLAEVVLRTPFDMGPFASMASPTVGTWDPWDGWLDVVCADPASIHHDPKVVTSYLGTDER